MKDIDIGYIIPQKWALAFGFLSDVDVQHHPDTLYLTCTECNGSLVGRFPDVTLTNLIVSSKHGTIGDWIRSYASDISKC